MPILPIIYISFSLIVGILIVALVMQRDSARQKVIIDENNINILSQRLSNEEDERKRLEEVISSLKSEMSSLEGELDASTDPKLALERLRRVFSSAAPSTNSATSSMSIKPTTPKSTN